MTLQEAEFIVHEFKKVTVIQSAEVVPNIDGDYSVVVTAIFRDLSIAAKTLGIARAEEDFGNMAYATLARAMFPGSALERRGRHGGTQTQTARSSKGSNQATW